MNVFLSADIEGTCGIADWSETERGTPYDYNYFKKQMTREVCAACEGALAGGADAVFVKDAHDTARNLDPAALPEQARVMRGWTGDLLSMMSGLDQGEYGAALFTGCHAWAASGGNPLSHTMNGMNEYVTLNGTRMSEFLMNAYTAGYFGVPVPLLTGDRALCDFARELIPNILTVPVNEGRGGRGGGHAPGRGGAGHQGQRQKGGQAGGQVLRAHAGPLRRGGALPGAPAGLFPPLLPRRGAGGREEREIFL